MSDVHSQFVGSIPENYDTHLGPFFFDFYAADLAARLRVPPAGSILEVACGTGISTEALRAVAPETVQIVATDLNEPMLDHARVRRGHLPGVSFQAADATQLPMEGGSFDAVVCQFGLMFMEDKLEALREWRRVLKPGGGLLLNVWDSLERNAAVSIAHRTIVSFFEEDPPMFLPVPFGFHDVDVLRSLLVDAGYEDIAIEVVPTEVERPSARGVATGLVEGNPTILQVRERARVEPEEVIEAVADALRQALGDAPMRTSLQAIVVTARA